KGGKGISKKVATIQSVPDEEESDSGTSGRVVMKSHLSIPAVSLTDAGVYKAKAANKVAFDTSSEASVCVIDYATTITTVKPGGKAVLNAGVAGPVLSYQWLKNGISMPPDNPLDKRISGTKTATL